MMKKESASRSMGPPEAFSSAAAKSTGPFAMRSPPRKQYARKQRHYAEKNAERLAMGDVPRFFFEALFACNILFYAVFCRKVANESLFYRSFSKKVAFQSHK